MTNSERIQANNAELREAIELAESLPDAGTSVEVVLQSKTVTPTKSAQEVTADDGYTALEKVTVEAIPNAYIVPEGMLDIGANGEYDAAAFEKVSVNVPIPDGYIKPSGTLEITENGTHDVTAYASVNVNVSADGDGDDLAGAIADRSIVEFRSEQCAKIGAYSFRGCENLETLVAPNAKSVGEYALYNCSKLQSIVLPSVETVSANAFREASNLEVIDLPKLSAIPGTAFYGCRALKALILRSNTMVTLSSTSSFTQCYRMLGTKNPGYNPTGEKIGWVYVPSVVLDEYLADSTWVSSTLQFRAIEDYPEICG